jgi:hypothetical protein
MFVLYVLLIAAGIVVYAIIGIAHMYVGQNWQSEFLAVETMVVFTIYLRQRGSPESKPVGAPHEETGTSG